MRIWGAITLLVVVATYAAGVAAPFELQDDHRIIAPAIAPHPGAVRMWIDALRLDVTEVGRFRPVNQIFDVVGPVVLGPNPALWHGFLLAIAAIVTLLLYSAGAIAWRSPLAGAVFALVTMLAPDPGPTAAWYRLGPKEGWAMIFVAAALLLMAMNAERKRGAATEVATFVLVVLAAFSKEPFVLLVPAFFGIRIWLERRARNVSVLDAVQGLRSVAIAYAAVFVAGLAAIAYVVRSAGTHSYGAKSLGMSLGGIAHVFLRDVMCAPALAIWFIPPLLALLIHRRVDLFGLLVALAWAAPQYAMYATRGGLWDHYWIPCIVGFAAVDAAAIAALARDPAAFKIAAVVTVLWLVNAVRIDAFAVRNFVTRAGVQQAATKVAAEHAEPSKDLVIVSNYAVESERADAFADFVRFDGGRYRRVLMVDSACTAPCVAVAGDPGTVAFLDHDRPAPVLGSWYARSDMQFIRVAADQRFFSLRHLTVTREPFSFVIAVRRPESGS